MLLKNLRNIITKLKRKEIFEKLPKEKFEKLYEMTYDKQKQPSGRTKNIIKSGILNLTQILLNIPTTGLLNLGPNFAPFFKKLSY